jgi:hypothetical protein
MDIAFVMGSSLEREANGQGGKSIIGQLGFNIDSNILDDSLQPADVAY